MLQLILTIIIYLIIVIPVGVYLYHVAAGKRTLADPVFNRIDGAIYKISGINPNQGMNWKKYALCLLGTNAIMILIGIHHPADSEYWPVQPQRDWRHGGNPFLQHHHQLYDKHQPPALFR